MLSRYIASLLLGAGAGGAASFYYFRRKRDLTQPVQLHHALKHGMPDGEQLRFFKNFVVCFDARMRNPRWVLEHITREQTRGDGNRKNVEFYEDKGLDPRFRSRLSDFRDSGYDRGHMAPAANHKESANTMLETFVLSNVSPQVGKGFNRDYWARFERFVNLLTKTCNDVYIVTGPLFLPSRTPLGYMMQHPMIGQPPRLVSVPTHFYKVVLAERSGTTSEGIPIEDVVVGAFVIPNTPLPPDLPLTAFSVPLESLEEAAGLQFFPGFLNAGRRAVLDRAALAYQKWGRRQAQLRGHSTLSLDALPGALPVALPEPSSAVDSVKVGLAGAEIADAGEAATDLATSFEAGENGNGASLSQPLAESSSAAASISSSEGATTAESKSGSNGRKPRRSKSEKSAEAAVVPLSAGLGVMHVCDFAECKLPPEDWYLASKNRRT